MNGYTKADNWLWDYVMPQAKPNTFKIVAAVVRMTAGWQQEKAAITFDDFHALTGISSRGTLTRAIDDALTEGYVQREEDGRSFIYSLKIVPCDGPKIVPADGGTVSKSYRERSQNRTDSSTESRPPHSSTIKEKKEKKEKERAAREEPPNGFWNIPHNLDSRGFVRAWGNWLAYVEERGLDFTETQATLTLQELSGHGEAVAIESVRNSIRKGWRNVYVGERSSRSRASPSTNGNHKPIYEADETGAY